MVDGALSRDAPILSASVPIVSAFFSVSVIEAKLVSVSVSVFLKSIGYRYRQWKISPIPILENNKLNSWIILEKAEINSIDL